jgi:hypothetical protein
MKLEIEEILGMLIIWSRDINTTHVTEFQKYQEDKHIT